MIEGAFIVCPGCGLRLPDRNLDPADRFNASGECLCMFFELTYWTLAHKDILFIHQYAVDAYEAQHAGRRTRAITVAFGLVGLYLALEKGYTGRQVQLPHMKIGKTRQDWPRLEPPENPAALTVMDVIRAGSDPEKEDMLMRRAEAVWQSWEPRHEWVRDVTERVLFRQDEWQR
jgi:hypothetical protein